ncbi:hypothetical protein Tco_0369749 [Tanacetum coccineum]
MQAVLTHHGYKKALGGIAHKPQSMSDEDWLELDEKALATIQLFLTREVLLSCFGFIQKNGNSFKPAAKTTTNLDGTSTTLIPGPVTTKEKVQKKNDMKARSMLLMALPNEHLMTFNQYKDAKTLFAAI